jgi:hydrogenase maturation protein HypF
MQNTSVAALAAKLLHDHGFRVLEHRIVPSNDGGIALGQAAIALHR